ncbi:MAG: exodeoxyribonuclease VII small subunit [Bacteroidota bacterium]
MKIESYEKAMQELQTILQALQAGTITMDSLSTKVARAQELIAYCKNELRTAEKAVKELLDGED